MKNLLVLLFAFAACAPPKEEKKIPFPVLTVTEAEWAVYEGRVVNENGEVEDIELSLKQAAVGVDSYYKLDRRKDDKTQPVKTIHPVAFNPMGSYSVNYGLANHEQGITVHCKMEGSPPHTITTENNRKITFPGFEDGEDIYFATQGTDKLILTDSDFKPFSATQNTLYKRLALFTAEGYVTADSVTSEFFERNTGEKWKLAKLIEYDSIKTVYKQLATEKNEGIYLKALAYSIVDPDSTSEGGKSLVIKSILRMEKSSRFNVIK
jgi:hypothetical protein